MKRKERNNKRKKKRLNEKKEDRGSVISLLSFPLLLVAVV
jgi:hypothetical protein